METPGKAAATYNDFRRLASEKREQSSYPQSVGDDVIDAVVSIANTKANAEWRPRPPKSEFALLQKVAKSTTGQPRSRRVTADDILSGVSEEKLRSILEGVTDYAGGRIIVHYLSDRLAVWKCLCEVASGHDCSLVPKPDDCNDLPRILPDEQLGETSPRQSGWRGVKVILRVKGEIVPYEVQILTYLQHDWDQKEHLIYEDPESFPKHITKRYSKIAKLLNDADKQFETLREVVQRYLQQVP